MASSSNDLEEPIFVKVCFNLDKHYNVGDIFIPPLGYPEIRLLELWARGWISDIDFSKLSEHLQEALTFPEWIDQFRKSLDCPNCSSFSAYTAGAELPH